MEFIRKVLIKLFPAKFSQFEGPFLSWEECLNTSKGYESDEFFSRARSSAMLVSKIETIYERDSVIFRDKEINEFILLWLFYQYSLSKNQVFNVLDFGGGYASSFYQNKKYLNSLPNLKWVIVEQDKVVNDCIDIFNTPNLFFTTSINSSIKFVNDINVVLISSSLQYVKNIEEILLELIAINSKLIIFDRIPFHFNNNENNCILTQKVNPKIYSTTYPFWAQSYFNFKSLLIKNGYSLLYDKVSREGSAVTRSNFQFEYHSLVFQKK
jgi:putative methyltransferase (TIGR04325 family)